MLHRQISQENIFKLKASFSLPPPSFSKIEISNLELQKKQPYNWYRLFLNFIPKKNPRQIDCSLIEENTSRSWNNSALKSSFLRKRSPRFLSASEAFKVEKMDSGEEDKCFLRTLEATDFSKERVREITARAPDYHIAVIEDLETGQIVASGTLFVERKILRSCGLVGHVEDVVVASSKRGQHLGKKIVTELVRVAKESGCYKVILDCAESNAPFYETCGFKRKEVQMALYF